MNPGFIAIILSALLTFAATFVKADTTYSVNEDYKEELVSSYDHPDLDEG